MKVNAVRIFSDALKSGQE
uniref:Uncharacterized protein n=1 Tax=Rhizophora mucronata TaxID=61149 RepID=A0A2P2NC11_RHIMU